MIKKSSEIGAEGVKEAMKGTRPGMYEYEIEAAARYIYTKRGARGDAFRPIIASGPNTLILHYSTNNRQMMDGDVVYIDYGAGIAYACTCYENGQIACSTSGPGHCYKDAGGRCHCKDAIIIIEEEAPPEEGGNN